MNLETRYNLAVLEVKNLKQELATAKAIALVTVGPQHGAMRRIQRRSIELLRLANIEYINATKARLKVNAQKPKYRLIFIDYPAMERRAGLSTGMIKDVSDAITSLREEYGVKVNYSSAQDVDKKVDTKLKTQYTPNLYQAGISQALQIVHHYSLIESLNIISASEDSITKWSREGRTVEWCADHIHIQYNTK